MCPLSRSYLTVTSCSLPWQPQAGPVLLPLMRKKHISRPRSPSPSPRPLCASAEHKIFLQRGRGLLLRRCHLQVGLEEPTALLQQGSSGPSSTPRPATLGRAVKAIKKTHP